MGTLIAFAIGLIMKLIPAISAGLKITQQAGDAIKSIHDATEDLHFADKQQDIKSRQEYARSIVAMAVLEGSYNIARGALQIAIYGIMTWGLCKMFQSLMGVMKPSEVGH
jgi:hypothetical protein